MDNMLGDDTFEVHLFQRCEELGPRAFERLAEL